MDVKKLWLERIEPRLIRSGSCLVWTGSTNGKKGYGKIGVTDKIAGRVVYLLVHRVAYAGNYGPIPAGRQVDHKCKNRKCCNPLHLELVSSLENSMRGQHPNFVACSKNTCRLGHVLKAPNVEYRKDGRPRCRRCLRDGEKRRRQQSLTSGGSQK